MKNQNINLDDLNQYLKDNDLILTLAQTLAGIGDGTGEPCPFCGGEDRFYYGAERGKFYCRKCMPNGIGHSVYDLVMSYNEIDFKESLKMVAIESGFLNSEQHSEKFQTFDLNEDSVAYKGVHKCRPEIDLSTYYRAGALEFVDENGIGVAIPIYNNLGDISGYVRYYTSGGKPMNSAGSKSGIVGQDARDALLQKRQVKIVFKCAGTSDFLVMSRLIIEADFEADYYTFTNACGENENPGKFDPILRPALEGQAVAVLRDNDAAGEAGAKKWAGHLATYAAEVRIVCPPQEWHGKPIKDLRDFVAASDNTNDVLQWIINAFENAEIITPDTVILWDQSKSSQSKNNAEPLVESQPFPVNALPDFMRDIVRTIAMAHSIPEASVAYPVLSYGATALGNQFKVICYPDGGGEFPTLWTGVFLPSGTGKTAVLQKLSAPFEVIEDRYREEMRQYNKEKEAGNTPETTPRKIHLLVGDATMEAIFVLCSETQHSLLLAEPEGRLFFAFDKYRKGSKTDESNYCKLYDSARFKINRKGDAAIEGTGTMNVAMMIQPDNFKKALEANPGMTSSGLLARMNLCYPTVGEFHLIGRIDNTAYNTWNDTITRNIDNRINPEGVIFVLNEAAQETWNRYMADCRNLARRTGGWLGGYYDRLHVTAICIAIQIHYFEGESWFMNLDAVERGITIAEYMRRETERIVAMFSDYESKDSMTAIIKTIIRKHAGEATIQNFRDGCSMFHAKGGTERLKDKLNEMVNAGILTVREEKAGNGKVVAYYSERNS